MDKTAYARGLRQDQTLAEKVLWSLVRNRHLGGFKFMRQIAIDRYFADFVCEAGKLIVELDGAVHKGRGRNHSPSHRLRRRAPPSL